MWTEHEAGGRNHGWPGEEVRQNFSCNLSHWPDRGLWRGVPRPENATSRQSAGRCMTGVCRHVRLLPPTDAFSSTTDGWISGRFSSFSLQLPCRKGGFGGRGNSIDSINNLRRAGDARFPKLWSHSEAATTRFLEHIWTIASPFVLFPP